MLNATLRNGILACAVGALVSCGGGSVNSTPGPIAATPPPPPPPPPPPGPPPNPEGPIGLVSNEPFATIGVVSNYAPGPDGKVIVAAHEPAEITLQYRGSDGSYVITLPNYRQGSLYTRGYNGSYNDGRAWTEIYGTSNELLDGESGRQDAVVVLSWPKGPLSREGTLTYTGWGRWEDDPSVDGTNTTGNLGFFAYGIPTAKQDVPTTGSASYYADVMGYSEQNLDPNGIYVDGIQGAALLHFDFGRGTLAGEMNASVCPWDCHSAGKYTFVETVYSTGSQTFSGQFAINGETVPSWFEGSFNGPQAAELMARFRAPYTYIYDGRDYSGIMGGIWIGKKN